MSITRFMRAAGISPEEKPIKEPKPRPARSRPGRASPTEIELVEASIAAVEYRISELEGKLAGDWNDMDVLTAHRAARDELQALLVRWEALFDDAQHSSP